MIISKAMWKKINIWGYRVSAKYNFLLCFIVLYGFLSGVNAQQYPMPKTYVAQKIDSIVVDGNMDDAWQNIPWTEDFIDIEGTKKPDFETKIKMAWDDAYFYVFAKLEEPHVWGHLQQRDTVIFYNNDFEIFIDPDGDTHNYYELEINALNTQWDLFLTKPYRNQGKVLDSWDIQGLQSAVSIEGTLNRASDIDKGWSLEIAIPWGVISEAALHGGPPKNEFWRINFSRVNWDFQLKNGKYQRKQGGNEEFLPEYNWVWSPQWVINMHEPEHWGYVYFTDAPITNFSVDKDEQLKYALYAVYRNWLAQPKGRKAITVDVLGKAIKVDYEPHATGWNLTAVSPFSNKKIVIKEDGKYIW
ncbi:carbohydrate-binding family 9-like protein [Croceivirga sp. JEA036]|uniref:carbohydrate-binding family 9-like protein n=1 Tax=Croceivirga sp. JEA036 TaxID=2721162 RepID=UPI001FD814AA|nr:carbohydrate-binding family 9-like protein [Croceivirga sp. JEA036]